VRLVYQIKTTVPSNEHKKNVLRVTKSNSTARLSGSPNILFYYHFIVHPLSDTIGAKYGEGKMAARHPDADFQIAGHQNANFQIAVHQNADIQIVDYQNANFPIAGHQNADI
jgi:uncharacterized protein YjbI with pentapeptide repeats